MFNFLIFSNEIKNKLASSLGSSLSRVSSSSPSSTPTDSESHGPGPQVLPTSHSIAHSLAPSIHNSEHDEEIAPPIASRPERTKSIYTRPIEETPSPPVSQHLSPTLKSPTLDKNKNNNAPNNISSNVNNTINNVTQVTTTTPTQPLPETRGGTKKKKMSDDEIIEKLRTIVSVGDPNRKYTRMEKIGQGSYLIFFTPLGQFTNSRHRLRAPRRTCDY